MPEMNVWPGFPLNQTPETMRFFFGQNSRSVGMHPPTFSHLNLPPVGAEKYGSASWGQAAELLKASERKFLRCAGKVLRAEKEKLFLLFERSSSKWIVFCNGFCNWVQRSWMFRPWKSHKIRVFKRVEWCPGNKTWEIFEETSSFCLKTRYDLIRTVLCRFY